VILAIGVAVVLVAGLAVVLLGRSTAPSPGPAGPAPSGQPIDLSGWKLTLPEVGKKGDAAIVDPADVTPPWLTRDGDGALTFWAPTSGATTKHSTHPRTELDSLSGFTAGNSGPQTMQATLAVTQVPPDTQDIIVGQIHGSGAISSIPFVMLHYRAGTVRVVVKQALERGGSALQDYSLIDGVALGQRFDFTITDGGDGSMTFSASSGGATKQATAPVPAAFAGQPVRFQIGDYQQSKDDPDSADPGAGAAPAVAATGSGEAGGRVSFSRIDASS
jgi:hypothetical protein